MKTAKMITTQNTLKKVHTILLLLLLCFSWQGMNPECKAATTVKPGMKTAPSKTKTITKPKNTAQIMVPFSKAQPKIESALAQVKGQHQRVIEAYQINRFRENTLRQLTANGMSLTVMPNAMKKIEDHKLNWDKDVTTFFTHQENALSDSLRVLAQKKMISQADINYLLQGVSIGQWRTSQLIKTLSQSVDIQARLAFVEKQIADVQANLKKASDWDKQHLTAQLAQFKQQEKTLKFSWDRTTARQKDLTEKPVFTALGLSPRLTLSKEDIQWGVIFQSAIDQQKTQKRLQEIASKTLETLKQKEFAYDKIRLSLDEQEKALLKQLDINPLSVPSNKSEDKTLQNKWEALTGEILTAKKITQPKTDVSGPDPFAQFDQWEKLNQQIRPNQLQDQVAQGETELQRLEQMEANLLELTAHKNTLRLELEGIQQTLQQLREQEQGIPDDPTLILFIR
jgi:hypothetical protein